MSDIALIGNPNCGKTTLFNSITGTYQKVGNWSGVTTEKKEGRYKKDKSIKVIDLPGIYSFLAESKDELAVLNYLKKSPPSCIINVIDGTNLERNLYLTGLIAKLKIPTVLAINFSDELIKKGIKIDIELLSKTLDVPVVEVSALKNINVDRLVLTAIKNKSTIKDIFSGDNNIDYATLSHIANSVLTKGENKDRLTDRLDVIFLNRFFGVFAFAIIIVMVYYLANNIGGYFSGIIERFFYRAEQNATCFLLSKSIPKWLVSLFCEGVVKGIGTVLSFLPQVLVLFSLLTILEESGYMARVSFNLDRAFRSFGLGGKSAIPFVLSSGCTVTGIMATRTIENIDERKMTIFLAPFMPCSAKCAVFGYFSYKFFNGNPFVSALMYFVGIFTILLFGKILKRLNRAGCKNQFILEMPPYRFPSIKDIFFVLKEKIKDFLIKSGTVIFLISVVIWTLTNFGLTGYTNGSVESSFLYYIGQGVKYIFYPLGINNWQTAVSLLTGIFAKEAVIETLELLGDAKSFFSSVNSVWPFMTFVLLSPPCIATLAVIKRELNSIKDFIKMLIFQIVVAYIVSLLSRGIVFIIINKHLLLSAVVGIIIAITIFASIKLIKCKRFSCKGCKGKLCKIKRVQQKHNTTI